MGKLTKEQRERANSMLSVLRQRDELESKIMRWIEEDPAEWVNRITVILRKQADKRTDDDARAINSFVLFGVTTIINGFREETVEAWREGREPFDFNNIFGD